MNILVELLINIALDIVQTLVNDVEPPLSNPGLELVKRYILVFKLDIEILIRQFKCL